MFSTIGPEVLGGMVRSGVRVNEILTMRYRDIIFWVKALNAHENEMQRRTSSG